ncbi:hypothetical protein [Nocardioides cynanchi]|uniref:hypothetical protein n=1 Tax=Nocardioides cynanchi TaxID=2558918 RepID=UPI00124637B5|nr:hypothetical protein [Nocardioides cynanchi]
MSATGSSGPVPVPGDDERRVGHSWGVRVLTLVALAGIAGWAVPAVLMADRGLSIQDEGSYLLAYRWWHSNPYFVPSSQYLYGPVFEAMGERIAALRLLRLGMAVGANLWFATAFCSWLARHRALDVPRATRWCGVALLTSTGGLAYLWGPLSPGYYDLEIVASLALVALFLQAVAREPRVPTWIPVLAGVTAFVLLLAKWPAVVTVALVEGAAVVILARTSRRSAARYVAGFGAGFAAAALGFLALVGHPADVLPVMLHAAAHPPYKHGVAFLTGYYARDTAELVLPALVFAVPTVGACVVAARLDDGRRVLGRALIVAGVLVTGLVIPLAVGWRGGDDRGRVMVSAVLALLLSAAVVAVLPGPHRRPADGVVAASSGRLVVGVLLVVPFGQAAGTAIPLLYVALGCLAMWVGVVLVLATSRDRTSASAFGIGAGLAMLVVAVALIAGTTTYQTPYFTTGFTADTQAVDALGGLRLSSTTAGQFQALVRATAPYVTPGRTPMLSLDRKEGLIYLLQGVPIGSTYTDSATPARTAYLIALACRNGDVDVSRAPVLLFDRPIDPRVVAALDGCGWDFPAAFRRLPVPGGPPTVTVWVHA